MTQAAWREILETELPALGHRNWIAIVDAAYPLQSRPGIKTVVTGAAQAEVAQAVLEAVAGAPHVRPVFYVDAELDYVREEDAPGVDEYRRALEGLMAMGGMTAKKMPHEEIIARLDQAATLFNVVIFKSTLTIPYTSVFVQLECGYWNEEAETRLRGEIARAGK